MRFVTDLAAFAAERKPILDRAEARIAPVVTDSLANYGEANWYVPIVDAAEAVLRATFADEAGKRTGPNLDDQVEAYRRDLTAALRKTGEPTDATADTITRWVATSAVNAGTFASAVAEVDQEMTLTWVTMHDTKVRPTHREADGQVVLLGAEFHVCGTTLAYPGDPAGPPECILNCRCVAAPGLASEAASAEGEAMTAAVDDDVAIDETDLEDAPGIEDDPEMDPVPWHAVLAPEGVASGDGRMFTAGALRWRELPLPLSYQKATASGHDGSVVVGKITDIWRVGDMVHATGLFDQSPEADEAIRQVVEEMIRGVSVDVDDATMELRDADGEAIDGMDIEALLTADSPLTAFTDGRICGATMCAIPAFPEAYIAIGEPPTEWIPEDGVVIDIIDADELVAAVSQKPWSDFKESDYSVEQWHRACLIHLHDGAATNKSDCKLPVREPSGTVNCNGVKAAWSALRGGRGGVDAPAGQKASATSALRGLYKQCGLDPAEGMALMDRFGYGPGRVTHPVDTERLMRYWAEGKGAAKIRWGEPHDFYRCRRHLRKYVPRPDYLNGLCANLHHRALGFWPGGEDPGRRKRHSGEPVDAGVRLVDAGCADCLVAAGLPPDLPHQWFADPGLDGPAPLVVEPSGRVFGHLAVFDTCHIGFEGVCVTPPRSASGYAYFRTGSVLTDGGPVPVGQITLDTGHADVRLGHRKALAHYDDTGTAVADVAAGEDEFGIWVAGALRPGLAEEKVAALRAASLSGDWRTVGGNLELVAALAVNVPGFPVTRVASGAQVTLVAAGVATPPPIVAEVEDRTDKIAAAVVDEMERRERQRRMRALRQQANKHRMAALAASLRR